RLRAPAVVLEGPTALARHAAGHRRASRPRVRPEGPGRWSNTLRQPSTRRESPQQFPATAVHTARPTIPGRHLFVVGALPADPLDDSTLHKSKLAPRARRRSRSAPVPPVLRTNDARSHFGSLPPFDSSRTEGDDIRRRSSMTIQTVVDRILDTPLPTASRNAIPFREWRPPRTIRCRTE